MPWIQLVFIKNYSLKILIFLFIEGKFYGVDINSNIGITNTYNIYVWEPIVVKQNALNAAAEVRLS